MRGEAVKARAAVRDPLVDELRAARRFLLDGAALVPDRKWREQPSPAYGPVSWQVGHVAATQARWLLPGEAVPERVAAFFEPVAPARTGRTKAPTPDELRACLDEVLDRVCAGLRAGRLPAILGLPETFLVQHIAQHELQHGEQVRIVAALCEKRLHRMAPEVHMRDAGRLELPGGRFRVGSDDAARAHDNERPAHEVELGPCFIDRSPVTAREFARFIEAGGYTERRLWTEAGFRWREEQGVRAPPGFDEQPPDAPVTCVSWYEADAYARWRGARLPTEAEREASGLPAAGVWEWTASWFGPYPGFRPYPSEAHSRPFFGTHRVLRGASWATAPELARNTLRRWAEPGLQKLPSGFRLAGDR